MNKIDNYIKLSEQEIIQFENEVYESHKILKQFGVELPRSDSLKMKWLIYLFAFKGQAVHKTVITDFCREFNPSCAADQQVRHLQADGWFLLKNGEEINGEKCPRGYYCIFDVEHPHPGFMKKQEFRTTTINANDFEELKKQYNYCCATCGAKEGENHRYGFAGKVQLQKGHMNPNKPLEIGNIIPQCQFCNRDMYKDNFIFDEFGRPIAVNNPKYISRSDEDIQYEIYKMLAKKFN